MELELEPPGAASFCLEPEPTQVGRSRSRLRDLGHQEPEPPKKVAAPQHCFRVADITTPRSLSSTVVSRTVLFMLYSYCLFLGPICINLHFWTLKAIPHRCAQPDSSSRVPYRVPVSLSSSSLIILATLVSSAKL